MTTTGAKLTEDEMKAAIALSIEQSKYHLELADGENVTQEEKRAHMMVVRALDKATEQMTEGNLPRYANNGIYMVTSRTTGGTVYMVDLKTQRCNCQNGRDCWHLAASNVVDEVRTMPHDKHIGADGVIEALPETGEPAADEDDNDLDGLGVFIDEMELQDAQSRAATWFIHKERGTYVVMSDKGEKWVKCPREEMAITIAALMNRDANAWLPVNDYLTTNGDLIMLKDSGEIIGIASDSETADVVDTRWFKLWIPF